MTSLIASALKPVDSVETGAKQVRFHLLFRSMNNTAYENDRLSIDENDQELSDAQLEQVSAGATETAGGGSTSTWKKIKSLIFGVDASFF